MRKVILSEFISLDGVIEEPPGWTFPYASKEQESFKFDELQASDALLLGRVTYEGFAAAWPNMIEQTGEYGVWMNTYPKYVVSRTLKDLAWNNSQVIEGDLSDAVTGLKQQQGKDILIFGSGELAHSLMQQDLIDEYRLMMFPVVLGGGKRLFADGVKLNLNLVDGQTFSSGVSVLTYQPANGRSA